MATLHLELTLELTDEYNYVVKKSYKVKTVKDVYNYLSAWLDNGYYKKTKKPKVVHNTPLMETRLLLS